MLLESFSHLPRPPRNVFLSGAVPSTSFIESTALIQYDCFRLYLSQMRPSILYLYALVLLALGMQAAVLSYPACIAACGGILRLVLPLAKTHV